VIPYVVDELVLMELARGDVAMTVLIMNYDASGQALVIPALAAAEAYRDCHTGEAAAALAGLPDLESTMFAPLGDMDQSLRLTDIASATGLDLPAAHVAAVAAESICPILTLDARRWKEASVHLDKPLYTIEVSDP
jgi:hypothetical protein